MNNHSDGFLFSDIKNRVTAAASVTLKDFNNVWGNTYYVKRSGGRPTRFSSHFLQPEFKKVITAQVVPSCTCVTLIRGFPTVGKERNFLEPGNGNPWPKSGILENWIHNLLIPFDIPLIIFVQNENLVKNVRAKIKTITDGHADHKLDITVCHTGDLRGCKPNAGVSAMNRFLGYDLYFTKQVEKFEFVWRLDSDAWFLEPPESNPLCQMHEYDIGFSMLGMPEINYNEKWLTTFKAWFLQRGNIIQPLSLFGDGGMKDTILAGPFELYRLSVFKNKMYTKFWMENKIDAMVDTAGIREQFIKTVWIHMAVAPIKINYFGELSMQHDNKIRFPRRCSLSIVNL